MAKRTRNPIICSLLSEHTKYWASPTTSVCTRPSTATTRNMKSYRKGDSISPSKDLNLQSTKEISKIVHNPVFIRNYYTLLSPEEKKKLVTYMQREHQKKSAKSFLEKYKTIKWPSPYQVRAKLCRKRVEINLAEEILDKYNSEYIAQRKQMNQYITLWLANIMKIVDAEKVGPEIYEFIESNLTSKDFIEKFDLDKPIKREQLFASFEEYLIKATQNNRKKLSSETLTQLKSIVEYSARLTNPSSILIKQEKEYHDLHIKKHDEQKPLRDNTYVNSLLKTSHDFVIESNVANQFMIKAQINKLTIPQILMEPKSCDSPLFPILINHVKEGNKAEVIQCLKKDSNLINGKDINGNTPLHWACKRGMLEIVQYLVEKGANFNEKNGQGKIPFDLAEINSNTYMFYHKQVHPVERLIKDSYKKFSFKQSITKLQRAVRMHQTKERYIKLGKQNASTKLLL